MILELGPGPGRFTPLLRRGKDRRVVLVDLSRESLLAGRRRARRGPLRTPTDWVHGAGERLPLRSRSVDAAVVLGNVISFAATDGPVLLRELHRVLKSGGRLIADFGSPAAAVQEFLRRGARHRFLPRVLRRPGYYLISTVLATGKQPLAPARWARWEFQFYTAQTARAALARAGFVVRDLLSVAPISASQDRVLEIARRETRTWRALLELEERVGRRDGVLEAGNGFIVAARRR
ncbi:MAG: class I SAM-dependent methyltransferase [Thermoplasmata archaeon]|nr:class I SAM-dependent methyltransferase [Thermoplasmata archaeon]